jgi:predicted 3-demethylubiquinone-9 3-methyltransferase (glyoxalase superfamily)
MQKITPFLWFDGQAEEAAKFYVSVFKNSKLGQITHYTGEEPPGRKGQVMTVDFELDGQQFVALNGGPDFKFTEAVSFLINCETQEEIDYYWEKLTADGGREVQCGWLADKYGLSWQVVPSKFFAEWAKDAVGLQRVMHEVMQMTKLDLATMKAAFERK